MIDIQLDKVKSEDVKAILELRKMGVPDKTIQKWYDKAMGKEEQGK